MDPAVNEYVNAFSTRQSGGGPLFINPRYQSGYGFGFGPRYQSGRGFMDVIGRVGRFFRPFIPTFAKVATGLLNGVSDAVASGDSISNAVTKQAVPLATTLIKDSANVLQNKLTAKQAQREDPPPESLENYKEVAKKAQNGSGKKRKRGYKKGRRSHKIYKPLEGFNF